MIDDTHALVLYTIAKSLQYSSTCTKILDELCEIFFFDLGYGSIYWSDVFFDLPSILNTTATCTV